MTIDHDIADLARRQYGVLAFRQLPPGYARSQLDRRVAAGQLERINHHAYRVAGAPISWEATVMAAVLDAPDGSLSSHLCGAALWDLDGFARRGQPVVSIPRGTMHRPAGVRCHTSTDLDRCTPVARSGIPTTDLARTLLDLGRYVSWSRLNRITEDARRTHELQLPTLIHTLMRHARQGRHGIRNLRAVIDAHADRTEVTDSEFEMLVLSLLAERGIRAPVLHHRVVVGTRLIAEVDFAWPDRWLAVELQGQHHRKDPAVWEADQLKAVELQGLGWTLLPFSWRTYMDRRDWMLMQIRRRLDPP